MSKDGENAKRANLRVLQGVRRQQDWALEQFG
jgi:hypothetical protein